MNSVPQFYAPSRAAWRAWLEENHASEQAVWLIFDKGAHRTMSWSDIVQEALCFGWIDSLPRKLSETQSMIYISRRKPKSEWSRVNKNHVAALIEQGRMTAAGLRAIEVAKANGSWDTLNASDDLIVPPDLLDALKARRNALKNFDAFPPSSRRNTLHWVYAAKRPETRAKRVTEVAEKAAQNVRTR